MNKAELMEIVDFLRPRAAMANCCRFDDAGRDSGVSSNALLEFAFTGVEPAKSKYPSDGDDLMACHRMYDKAPTGLREKMSPILAKYQAHVIARGEMG